LTAATEVTPRPDPPDPSTLRQQVRRHCGFDPGPLTPDHRLDDVGLSGLARLRLVTGLETTYQVELPSDLVSSLDTVDELLWFVGVKLDQRSGRQS
jgi:acyl carrier protein